MLKFERRQYLFNFIHLYFLLLISFISVMASSSVCAVEDADNNSTNTVRYSKTPKIPPVSGNSCKSYTKSRNSRISVDGINEGALKLDRSTDPYSVLEPLFDEESAINPWPRTAFKDYSVSFLALSRLIRKEYSFYKFLKVNKNAFLKELTGKVVHKINDYIAAYENEVELLLRRWNLVTKRNRNHKDIINHPILIYFMLRRCTFEFLPLYKALRRTERGKVLKPIALDKWPTQRDISEYVHLIQNIRFVYDFSHSQVAFDADETYISSVTSQNQIVRGYFGDSVEGITYAELLPMHIAQLGFVSLENGFFADSVEWMRVAHEIASLTWLMDDEVQKLYEDEFIAVADKHDAICTPNELFCFAQRVNRTLVKNENDTTNIRIYQERYRQGRNNSKEASYVNYMTLCQTGENWQSEAEKSKLYCWYDYSIGIFPFKFEVLHKEPLLLQIYEFISKSEKNHLILRAYKQPLQPAGTNKLMTDENESVYVKSRVVKTRAGSVAWLMDNDAILTKLERRIEWATKLNVRGRDTSESFHVAVSAPGGHISPHSDNHIYGESKRMATFLLYLNRVILGGRTSFPILGLSVQPEPGSAIFWYNSKPDGTSDDRMRHGGCPVVIGQKWVVTKWIREYNNQLCMKKLS